MIEIVLEPGSQTRLIKILAILSGDYAEYIFL